jgi:hypothetical protein
MAWGFLAVLALWKVPDVFLTADRAGQTLDAVALQSVLAKLRRTAQKSTPLLRLY